MSRTTLRLPRPLPVSCAVLIALLAFCSPGCSRNYMVPQVNEEGPTIFISQSRHHRTATATQKSSRRLTCRTRVFTEKEKEYVWVELWLLFRSRVLLDPRQVRCTVYDATGNQLEALWSLSDLSVDTAQNRIVGKLRFWNHARAAVPVPLRVHCSYGGDHFEFKFAWH